ncbi:hypothetical protein Gorai_015050 [Gossypium raimondii]|uniref:Uncharacterized protein n=1 Tax=Gossypium raimondii TaxID=29730 RepID=A0A0D2R6V9_GOSRA|nr:hypothetical protein B456_004G181300 [Gossypium raimondii]MBA0584226.1 hypothetical protein [Gossypium raimondii]
MVQLKTLFTSLLLFLLIFASSPRIGSATATADASLAHAAQSHQMRQRMNHGSYRGPRKHLLNPAVDHPLQLPKLSV